MLTCIRETKTTVLPESEEHGRHRRGEMIEFRVVPGVPAGGSVFTHDLFTWIYLTDIPDEREPGDLHERFTRPHDVEGQIRFYYVSATGGFKDNVPGSVVTGVNSSATGEIISVVSERDQGSMDLTNVNGEFELKEPVTGVQGQAVCEGYESLNLSRKRIFISVSDLVAPRRARAWNKDSGTYQGWDDVDFDVFINNWIKRRPKDAQPISEGDPADDDIDDAAGIWFDGKKGRK